MGLVEGVERGDLELAERMCRESLEINEKLGRLEHLAADYDNLGSVYRTRADPVQAREYWTNARGLYEKLGMRRVMCRMYKRL